MGCNNSHLRPFFRRCRRRSKKDDTNCTPKRQQNQNDLMMIESNHADANSSTDLLHGFHFIGSSSVRNPIAKLAPTDVSTSSEAPACVPLLAQSEVSTSQLDFFKMMDDKIQEGPDYDSEEDKEETERLIQRNLDTWKRSVTRNAWKLDGTNSRLANNSKSTRCQWDDDGDGG